MSSSVKDSTGTRDPAVSQTEASETVETAPIPTNPDFIIPQAPEGEFCVFGTVYAHPSTSSRLHDLYTQTTYAAHNHEPGTLAYCIARDRDPSKAHVFYFFERYSGRAAFEAHNSSEPVRRIIGEKLIDRCEARFCEPIRWRDEIENSDAENVRERERKA